MTLPEGKLMILINTIRNSRPRKVFLKIKSFRMKMKIILSIMISPVSWTRWLDWRMKDPMPNQNWFHSKRISLKLVDYLININHRPYTTTKLHKLKLWETTTSPKSSTKHRTPIEWECAKWTKAISKSTTSKNKTKNSITSTVLFETISNSAASTSKTSLSSTQTYLYHYSACHKPWEILIRGWSC